MENFENKKDEHGDIKMGTAKQIVARYIPVTEMIDYFTRRINATMDLIEPLPDTWGKSLLKDLVGKEWGMCASEGCYKDADTIESGVREILAAWKSKDMVESQGDAYRLTPKTLAAMLLGADITIEELEM